MRLSELEAGRLCERVEKRFCRLEIGRVEPLGESVVDRLEERHRISRTALVAVVLQTPVNLADGDKVQIIPEPPAATPECPEPKIRVLT